MNDDRYNGYTRLNRHVEAAFFEGAQLPRWGTGPLRRDDEALLFFLHCLHQWLHGLDRRLSVASINKHNACCTHEGADDRQVFQLPFTDAHNIPADQAGHDQHVSVALVVEHEDCRALFPEVFSAAHIEIQSDQCAGSFGEQGNREIERVPP